jgi:hypothetical protein
MGKRRDTSRTSVEDCVGRYPFGKPKVDGRIALS